MSLRKGSLLYFDGNVRMVSFIDETGKPRTYAYLIESRHEVLRNAPSREDTAGNLEAEHSDSNAVAVDEMDGAAEDRTAAESAHTA